MVLGRAPGEGFNLFSTMSCLAAYLRNLQRFGIQPGLERIEALLESVGNPQHQYPHILVGGTNGKGSTCEFAARILAQNGRRIGLFTSPHLYEWNERIRVLPGSGLFEGAISDQELDALFDDGMPHIEAVARELGQPTEFEVLTFLGLWHFARAGVDAAIIEVGLGGKWDATNASDPLVSVVTHVALDHMDRLGDTLEGIAADKVCIARPNRPFVTGEWKKNVNGVFLRYCAQIGALILFVAPSRFLHKQAKQQDFQYSNYRVAYEAVRQLCEQLKWATPEENYTPIQVPGRLEAIASDPRLFIDAANNPDGAAHLAQKVRKTKNIQPESLLLVLGILSDKNWREMTQILAPLARTVICCQSDSPRALDSEELATFARTIHPAVEVVRDVQPAVERARELASPQDTILVTGSFTTIAQVSREV